MITLNRTGVGVVDHPGTVRDSRGTGMLPVQAGGDGTTTFRVLGRVSADAPWVELRGAGNGDFLESMAWVPYLRLEITAGAGSVSVWIGEA